MVNSLQISSLCKVRKDAPFNYEEISEHTMLSNERFCYQIALQTEQYETFYAELVSELKDFIKLYKVNDAVMDYPTYPSCCDEDYITKTPGLMPDILIPLSSGNNLITAGPYPTAVWAELNIPKGFKGGKYEISLKFTLADAASLKMENSDFKEYSCIKTMTVNILDKSLCEQKIKFTQWLYADCIAKTHNVEVFSEAHWYLIEQYIKKAAHLGINMMLTPIHTPPLDTSRGTVRPCVQLVNISKIGDEFSFSFERNGHKRLDKQLKVWYNTQRKYLIFLMLGVM